MKRQFQKVVDGDFGRRRVHELGVECLVAHSTIGAQEGNEWWRLGSLADGKDSIGWETLQNDYNRSCQPRDPKNTRRTVVEVQKEL